MDQVRLNYTIAEALEKQLTIYCLVTGRTASDVVRQLIYEFLEGDRALPPPAVIAAQSRNGPRRDRRTDMWVSSQTFKTFHERLESEGYAGKSPVIAFLLGDFLAHRTNSTAEELVRVTLLLDRETFAYLKNTGAVKPLSPEQFIAELTRDYVKKLKTAGN